MIVHQSKIEFGTGDVNINCLADKGLAMLVLQNQQPTEIGIMHETKGQFMSAEKKDAAPVILSFSSAKSVDALILALQRIKQGAFGSEAN